MSDDIDEMQEAATLLGGIVALAFLANVLFAGMDATNGQSFLAGLVDYGILIWGAALTIVLSLVVWVISALLIEYLLVDFASDVRGWMNR